MLLDRKIDVIFEPDLAPGRGIPDHWRIKPTRTDASRNGNATFDLRVHKLLPIDTRQKEGFRLCGPKPNGNVQPLPRATASDHAC